MFADHSKHMVTSLIDDNGEGHLGVTSGRTPCTCTDHREFGVSARVRGDGSGRWRVTVEAPEAGDAEDLHAEMMEAVRRWRNGVQAARRGGAGPRDRGVVIARSDLDGLGTDELHVALTVAMRELPEGHPVRVIWEELDAILTEGGVECLPSVWDKLPQYQGESSG